MEIHKLSHLILTAILRSRCHQLHLHEGALLFYSRDSIAHSETLFYIWKVLLYFFFLLFKQAFIYNLSYAEQKRYKHG